MLAGERADREVIAALLDVRQLADPVQVDQDLGGREPEPHRGDQALAAGEDLRRVAQPREQGERLVERRGRVVVEGRWDHGCSGEWFGVQRR